MLRLLLCDLARAASRFGNMQAVGHGLILLVKIGQPQADGVLIRHRTDITHDRLALIARHKLHKLFDLRVLLLKVGYDIQRAVEHILTGTDALGARFLAIKLQDLGGLVFYQLAGTADARYAHAPRVPFPRPFNWSG